MFRKFVFAVVWLVSGAATAEPMRSSLDIGVMAFSRCLEFAGEPTDFRQWAAQTGVTRAPPDIEKAYLDTLHGGGELFGYASSTGEVAISSQNDGGCTVFIDRVDSGQLISRIEAYLNDNHFSPVTPNVTERKGSPISMSSRDYELALGERRWRLVISTSSPPGAARFDALITVYGTPERK